MTISVSAQAINAYNQVSKIESNPMSPQVSNVGAPNFKDMVIQFNKLAQMSQTEILSQLSQSRAPMHTAADLFFATTNIAELRHKVQTSERTALNNALGKASATEVATSAAQASNAISLAVALRNKMQEALDKLFNMNL